MFFVLLFQWLIGAVRILINAKRSEIPDRRITFWDLFGSDLIEDEYLREKILAENISKLSPSYYLKSQRRSIVGITENFLAGGVAAPPIKFMVDEKELVI